MDIMVKGTGKRFYKADEVAIRLNFYTNTDSYDTALEEGTKNVQDFIEKVLYQMKFSKEDLKTRSFRIYEDKKYDYKNNIEKSYGFVYEQMANIKFDYDLNVVAEFMERVSKLSNPPRYTISFNVKDEKKSKEEVLSDAYNMAKEKAEAIAKAAGKNLKECIKTDFRPFEERVNSYSSLDNSMFESSSARGSNRAKMATAQETIINTFTPEDIEISETLYCLWITD